MIAALLLVQFVGVPFAFLFGALAGTHRREDARSSSGSRSTR